MSSAVIASGTARGQARAKRSKIRATSSGIVTLILVALVALWQVA
ncbi:MAG: hypothetical protein QOH33_1947, partial [Paraburkholderia sp.]|nr:hypothetical protein [Paraburkholderia sp.]